MTRSFNLSLPSRYQRMNTGKLEGCALHCDNVSFQDLAQLVCPGLESCNRTVICQATAEKTAPKEAVV